jgi:hypothetical protein
VCERREKLNRKPDAGNPHVRFEEAECRDGGMVRLFRHSQTKGRAPDKPGLNSPRYISTLQTETAPLEKINNIISKHNKKSDNFDSQVDESKTALEMHYIADFIASYFEVLDEIKVLKKDHSDLVNTIKTKEQKISNLKETLISHYIPAEQINKDLKHFLGRGDIRLVATDEQEAYQIFRNGELA